MAKERNLSKNFTFCCSELISLWLSSRKIRELQKHLFDFIGAGTITPEFLINEKYKQNNKSLDIEYFKLENLYKAKSDYTDSEINLFIF